MKRVNALKVRNNFGEILAMLDAERLPILIEKRKKPRAVLISYEEFKARFVDKLAEEERDRFISRLRAEAAASQIDADPITTLRSIRGYTD